MGCQLGGASVGTLFQGRSSVTRGVRGMKRETHCNVYQEGNTHALQDMWVRKQENKRA